MKSSEITQTLFEFAQKHSLQVYAMNSDPPFLEAIGGISLWRTAVTARVEGGESDLIKFIADLYIKAIT